MHLHIDLIENDWLAGQQRVVAGLSVVRGQYDFRTGDLPRWARVLEPAKLPSPAPTDGVEDLLKVVSSRIQGDYVFATEPHDAEECPYPSVLFLQRPGKAAPKARRPAEVR